MEITVTIPLLLHLDHHHHPTCQGEGVPLQHQHHHISSTEHPSLVALTSGSLILASIQLMPFSNPSQVPLEGRILPCLNPFLPLDGLDQQSTRGIHLGFEMMKMMMTVLKM